MPRWNLREGILTDLGVSDDEYWSLFNFVFSDACRETNTYKVGLIKSIYYVYDDGNGLFLSYEKIFTKFAEKYWNFDNKNKLKQMLYNGKSEYSRIKMILIDAVETEIVGFQSLS